MYLVNTKTNQKLQIYVEGKTSNIVNTHTHLMDVGKVNLVVEFCCNVTTIFGRLVEFTKSDRLCKQGRELFLRQILVGTTELTGVYILMIYHPQLYPFRPVIEEFEDKEYVLVCTDILLEFIN